MSTAYMERSAVISDCGRYRYRLSRTWDSTIAAATFVMLNASTADADQDDPTVGRCVGFAKSWGYGGLVVVNAYGLRATDPRELRRAADPVGPENDLWLKAAAKQAAAWGAPLVAAWGTHAKPSRVAWICELPGFDRLTCLRTTASGAPGHPLYVPASATLTPWRMP